MTTEVPIGDALVVDLHSQTLCLKDALASGSDRAVTHALEAVARARGLTQLAADIGMDRGRLASMLDEAVTTGADDLRSVVGALIARWGAALQTNPSGFLEEDDPADEKTRRKGLT